MSAFDVFISYNGQDRQLVLKLAEALKERGLKVWLDVWKVKPGERWINAIEDILTTCKSAIVCVGPNGFSEWSERESQALLIRSKKKKTSDEYWPLIPLFLPGTPLEEELPKFLDLYAWIDLRSGFNKEDLDRLQSGIQDVKVGSSADPPIPPGRQCPFPGFRPFSEDDRAIFFGREHEVAKPLKHLGVLQGGHPRRWLMIEGDSGVGKSSFLNAGLIPEIKNSSISDENSSNRRDAVFWHVLPTMQPGNDPTGELVDILLKSFSCKRESLNQKLADKKQPRALQYFLRDHTDKSQKIILVVDQLEDIVRFQQDEDSIETFDRVVSEALRVIGGPLQLITAIRSDYFHHCLRRLPRLSEHFSEYSNRFTLPPLDYDGIKMVIQNSFHVAGFKCDQALINIIIADAVKSERASLPLTQNLLQMIWKSTIRKNCPLVTRELYKDLGEIGGALLDQVNDFSKDPDAQQKEKLKILLELVEIKQDTKEEPRSITLESAMNTVGGYEGRVKILDILSGLHSAHTRDYDKVNPRLITIATVEDENENARYRVDLAHQNLLKMKELHELIKKNHKDLREFYNFRFDFESLGAKGKNNDSVDNNEKKLDETKWPHKRCIDAIESIQNLERWNDLTEAERRALGPLTENDVVDEINNPATKDDRRQWLGERLSVIGDDREGTRVVKKVPEIKWIQVSEGTVTIEVQRLQSSGRAWRLLPKNLSKPLQELYFSRTKLLKKDIKPFYIGKFLITSKQYEAFTEAPDGYNNKDWWVDFPENFQPDKEAPAPIPQWNFDNHPVNNVSWYAATAFCKWLTKKLKIDGEVQLPNEWEWQLAAEGAEGIDGNTADTKLNRTAAVGMFPYPKSGTEKESEKPLDMVGNLWEWCRNKFDIAENEKYSSIDYETRVIRGGSWDTPKKEATIKGRMPTLPYLFTCGIGFRVMCKDPFKLK